MDELRAPDPTLTALPFREIVVVDDSAEPAPIAHRLDDNDPFGGTLCEEPGYAGADPCLFTEHARWFAVPCRECFPDAPPPGHSLCSPDTCGGARGEHMDPGLTWQVQL